MKNNILTTVSKHCLGLDSYQPPATILPRSFDMNVAETNWGKQYG